MHQVRRSVLLHISFSDVIVVVLEEAHTGIASGIEIIHEQRRFAKFCHSLLKGFCWILRLLDAIFLKLLIVQFFNRCFRAFAEIERRVEVVWKLRDSRHNSRGLQLVPWSWRRLGSSDAIVVKAQVWKHVALAPGIKINILGNQQEVPLLFALPIVLKAPSLDTKN